MARAAAADHGVEIPPAAPDPQRAVVAVLCLHAVTQGQHRRQEDDGRLVVGMAAGVGLGRQVLGQGNACRPAGLLRA